MLAKAAGAKAYAAGHNIVFGAGQYAPAQAPGRWLLAHELAHVAQQRSGAHPSPMSMVEADANHAATAVLTGAPVSVRMRHDGREIHRFGEPQHLPQITYVAGQNPQGDGFLSDALAYHRTWGLAPQPINSMEAILDDLSGSTSGLSRIRIVTHASQTNLFTAMFNGDSPGILEGTLRAFGQGDVAGLSERLGQFVDAQTVALVVSELQQNNPTVLAPFGLTQGGTPTGAVAALIQRSAELLMFQTATGGTASQTQTIVTSLQTVLAGLRQQLQQPPPTGVGVTAADALALQSAITGLTTVTFGALPNQPADFIQGLQSANRAIGNNFRRKLERTRARMSSGSWIDIRGCRVGASPTYLDAIAEFFANGTQRPHVSGPEWFQSFPTLGYQTLTATQIPTVAGDADVQRALEHWAAVTGIRRQILWWRRFYLNILIQDQLAQSAQGSAAGHPSLLNPPPLFGGLPLPMFGESLLPLPSLTLTPPTFGQPPVSQPGLSAPSLGNPLVRMAREELARMDDPNYELTYYLNAALVLPVQRAADVEDVRLFMLHAQRNQAIDNWLASQWAPAAPGLRALQRGAWDSGAARRVAALTKLRGDGTVADQEMVFSPDPRYQEHIKSI